MNALPASNPRPWIRDAAAHAETARRAFELWRQNGRPAGKEVELWQEAERQLFGATLTGGGPLPLPSRTA